MFAMARVLAQAIDETKTVNAQADEKAALHAELKKFEGSWSWSYGNPCNTEPKTNYHLKVKNNRIYGTSNYTLGGRVYETKILGNIINKKLYLKECYPILDHGNEEPICPKYTDYGKKFYYISSIKNKCLDVK